MRLREHAEPVGGKFFTPGVFLLLGLMAVGLVFAIVRFLFGLGSITNLSNQFPWGLWIGIDVVTGVALAAGGFTTGALVYVLNRDQYEAVIRPALLTAMLGYTFVIIGLFLDVGRYWNIWRPLVSGNPTSILFEVALCVVLYTTVLYIEFVPVVTERFQGRVSLPGPLGFLNKPVDRSLGLADRTLGKVMFLFVIAGIVLSCLHQSGLGSLMLVAPYKVHPLWYTPILPLLFLLSAIAVGYPMVVFESLAAARALKREPEMEVLTPLARFMPVLIGVYLAFKLADMFARGTYTYLLDGTLQSNAFLAEMVLGVIAPFILLLVKEVRRSPGWLFFASTLYVVGVALNRVNVFIIGFNPPYMITRYFPAVGELAVTIGLIAAFLFFYKLFVVEFPVLTRTRGQASVTVFLLAVGLVTLCPEGVGATEEEMSEGKIIALSERQITSWVDEGPRTRILNDPVINTYTDDYGPVRFMHRKHAGVVRDCTICHHRVPREKGDKYGHPMKMEEMVDTRIMPKACSSCHDHPWDPKRIHVPGLKGAYHQMCIGCHRVSIQRMDMNKILYPASMKGIEGAGSLSGRAPIDCISCHGKKTPDHRDLVKLKEGADAPTVTKICLSCHGEQARDILNTAHWKWQGPSPFVLGHSRRNDLGKRSQTINNTAISLAGNMSRCTVCHIGHGWGAGGIDFADMTKIDCLVCHDTTGTYKRYGNGTGAGELPVHLSSVAKQVGKPSRRNCGANCHFSGGKADPVRHGTMSPKLLEPTENMDVHMAADGLNFKCQDCHKTRNHKISGRSLSVPWVEGYFTCEGCHTQNPHAGRSPLAYHLNKHTAHVACQTCHIPLYSKGSAALVRWDWSEGARGLESADLPNKTQGGPARTYGKLTWKETIKPVYLWYNGTTRRYLLGDPVNENGATVLSMPLGNRKDQASKIYPFKAVTGRQISDAVYRILAPLRVWGENGDDFNWKKAANEGLAGVGLPSSGKYEFVETIAYHGVNHEVVPKERALSCARCHAALNNKQACGRCHKQREDIDFRALANKGIDFRVLVEEGLHVSELIDRTDYIDFEALGYPGDPVEVGGRFKTLPVLTGAQALLQDTTSWCEE